MSGNAVEADEPGSVPSAPADYRSNPSFRARARVTQIVGPEHPALLGVGSGTETDRWSAASWLLHGRALRGGALSSAGLGGAVPLTWRLDGVGELAETRSLFAATTGATPFAAVQMLLGCCLYRSLIRPADQASKRL